MINKNKNAPYLSIVIPMYNRESCIGRALSSCLNQSFTNYEIIVVDDASTDASVAIVQSTADARIRLVCQSENKGVCPARMEGVAQASGEWIIFLDSDDELLPGALARIAQHAQEATAEIARLAFMYEYDTGGMSPEPPLQESVLDYRGYLTWLDSLTGRSDFNNCIRRETFRHVCLPENRGYEALYHLDFASRYLTKTVPEAVAMAHTDAHNRSAAASVRRMLADAPDYAEMLEQVLKRHGEMLKRHAPKSYRAFLKTAAIQYFLAKRRHAAQRYCLQYLRMKPLSADGWVILISGAINAHLLAQVRALKTSMAKI